MSANIPRNILSLRGQRVKKIEKSLESGANPKEIKRLMGHSSIRVTFDVYGHLFEEHDDRRADRANQIAAGLLTAEINALRAAT